VRNIFRPHFHAKAEFLISRSFLIVKRFHCVCESYAKAKKAISESKRAKEDIRKRSTEEKKQK
jgi:hypothetical protein